MRMTPDGCDALSQEQTGWTIVLGSARTTDLHVGVLRYLNDLRLM